MKAEMELGAGPDEEEKRHWHDKLDHLPGKLKLLEDHLNHR